MQYKKLHEWKLTVREAMNLQVELSKRVSTKDCFSEIKTICGIDVGIKGNKGIATLVFLNFPDMKILGVCSATERVTFPYVPGLLSFRETPIILKAVEETNAEADIFMIDGQGIAHPRRFGIASHIGLLLDKPTIGCAKSLLCGTYREPAIEAGSFTDLIDKNEKVGAIVRTKHKTNPVFVSVGHKISLHTAIKITLQCCKGYRIPEPTRQAHRFSG